MEGRRTVGQGAERFMAKWVTACRESQDWATTCNSMPERDGEDQRKDSPKRAGSWWFACHS